MNQKKSPTAAPLPPKKRVDLTEETSAELHISYQVTLVANLMAFGNSAENVKRFGLNFREWRVLGGIGQLGPRTARQLVDDIHQDKATISRAITDLSHKGLITKLPNKLHKRSPLIWMTEEGKALYEEILPEFARQAELFTDVLSESEKTQLCNILDKLKDHIEDVRVREGLE
jgi:DNA-binding MarR family transcriptional regulator